MAEKTTETMTIKSFPIDKIQESPFNPRKIDQKTLEKLMASIREFGYVDPLIVNKRNMQVVGGNQRLKALRELGWKTVQVVLVDLEDRKEKALNVALNKISGDWNFDKLREIMLELEDDDKLLTGFDNAEIDILVNSFGNDLPNEPGPGEGQDGDGLPSDPGSSGGSTGSGPAGAGAPNAPPPDGVSFVVYVSFPTQTAAESWLASQGINHTFKPGNRTFIIRKGEETTEKTEGAKIQ